MSDIAAKKYFLSISKQQLALLPAAKFEGRIVIVENARQAAEAIEYLRGADLIGFDTETRPSFKKGSLNEVALVQLSTRDTCFLFRLCRIGLPDELKKILEDSEITKIGLSVHDDFHNLHRLSDFEPAGFIDLQSFVKNYRIADNSLSRIYAIVFGQRISKGQRLSNWEAEHLSSAQQAYASLDALACIRIYENLLSGSFDPESSPYKQLPDEENEPEAK